MPEANVALKTIDLAYPLPNALSEVFGTGRLQHIFRLNMYFRYAGRKGRNGIKLFELSTVVQLKT